MFIDGISKPVKTSSSNKAKKKSESADGESFSSFISQDGASAGQTSSTDQVSQAGGILSSGLVAGLNIFEEKSQTSQEQVEISYDILEDLKNVRNQLLLGQISKTTLLNIRQKIDSISKNIADEKLESLVEEIKTRAEVELVKLENRK